VSDVPARYIRLDRSGLYLDGTWPIDIPAIRAAIDAADEAADMWGLDEWDEAFGGECPPSLSSSPDALALMAEWGMDPGMIYEARRVRLPADLMSRQAKIVLWGGVVGGKHQRG
jgi:hypothetical protein